MKEIKVNDNTINITHPDKILFPLEGINKKDLAHYYLKISDHMLPFLKDFPITINCFPEGVEKQGFFRQHAPKSLPSWFKTATLKTKNGEEMTHMLCQNKQTLVYLANQNAIEIHRWLSKVSNPDHPDIMVIDIDPPYGRFDFAILAAKLLKDKLKERGYNTDLMLTGSKGLHIISQCKDQENFEQIRDKLKKLTKQLSAEHEDKFTTDIRKDKRAGKVYLDLSRNAYGQTVIVPFSPSAKENSPIAMPIGWEELDSSDVKSDKYTIKNVFNLLK